MNIPDAHASDLPHAGRPSRARSVIGSREKERDMRWMMLVVLLIGCGGAEPREMVEDEDAEIRRFCTETCGADDRCEGLRSDVSTWRCLCDHPRDPGRLDYGTTSRCEPGGECVWLTDNPANCGRCGAVCPPDRWCDDGKCLPLDSEYCDMESCVL